MKDELKLLNEDVWGVVCGEDGRSMVIETNITGEWRHGTIEETIVKVRLSGKFYKSIYHNSPKDMCFEDMNGSEANFFEVVPKEKTIIVYLIKEISCPPPLT
jgi:hypothetical protein